MMPEKKESYSRDALGARMSKKLCLNLVNNVEEWLNKSKKKKKKTGKILEAFENTASPPRLKTGPQ